MGIVAWLVLGAVAGYVATRLDQRPGRIGLFADILIGIIGALVGGFIAAVMVPADPVSSIEIRSMIAAVVGAGAAVLAWDAITRAPRTATSPHRPA